MLFRLLKVYVPRSTCKNTKKQWVHTNNSVFLLKNKQNKYMKALPHLQHGSNFHIINEQV